jgi:hypothetical protein
MKCILCSNILHLQILFYLCHCDIAKARKLQNNTIITYNNNNEGSNFQRKTLS